MSSSVTTPYGPIGTTPTTIRPIRARQHSGRVLSAIRWLAAAVCLAALLGSGAWLAVAAVPAAECEQYGSCTLAAIMTYGTPV